MSFLSSFRNSTVGDLTSNATIKFDSNSSGMFQKFTILIDVSWAYINTTDNKFYATGIPTTFENTTIQLKAIMYDVNNAELEALINITVNPANQAPKIVHTVVDQSALVSKILQTMIL